MSAAPIITEIIGLFFIVLYLLHKYGNIRRQNILVSIATFIAWYFSFMIIFLLPLDISITTYRQCLFDNNLNPTLTDTPANQTICEIPWSYVPDRVFPILWRIIYWTSQALTWIILPFMQSFTQSAEFSFSGKFKNSLFRNGVYYGTYLGIFSVLLIYVALKHSIDGQKLKVIIITASNTWGLFLLVLLLGYGLVDVPRSLWSKSKYSFRLKQLYFNLAKLHSEKCEAEEELDDVFNEIKDVSDKIKYNHPFRTYVDKILKKCPDSFTSNLRRNLEDFHDYNTDPLSVDRSMPTENSLVKLHKRLISALQTHKRTQNQWTSLLYDTFILEDVVLSDDNSNRTLFKSFEWRQNSVEQKICNPLLGWIYYCIIRKWMLKLFAVISISITLMVIWSEITFFNKHPVLSLHAIFLNAARSGYNYITIELLCCANIAFLCFCAYYTIFKIRIFNYYYLASNHMTDENSLLFSATLVCRLTSPLCYNFLGLVHLDSHITKDTKIVETAFTSIMGHMDVISFISDGFNLYFPMLISILCLATFFNIGGRVLHFFGFQQFIGDADVTQEFIEDGKNIVKREKRLIQRGNSESQSQRRKEITQRWRATDSSTSLGALQNDQRIKDVKPVTILDDDDDDLRANTRRGEYSYIGTSKKSFFDKNSSNNNNSNKYREYEKLLNYKINEPYTDNPSGFNGASSSGMKTSRNIFSDI